MGRGKAWWESECVSLCHAWVAVAVADTQAAAAGRPSFYEKLHSKYNTLISVNAEPSQDDPTPSAKPRNPASASRSGNVDDRSASSSLSMAQQDDTPVTGSDIPSAPLVGLGTPSNRRSEPRSLVATRAKWKEIARAVVEFDMHLRNVRAQATKTRDNDEYSILSKAIARQNGIPGSHDPNFNPYSSAGGPGSFEYMACWEYLRKIDPFWNLYRPDNERKARRETGASTVKNTDNDTDTEKTNSLRDKNNTEYSSTAPQTSTVGGRHESKQPQRHTRASKGVVSQLQTSRKVGDATIRHRKLVRQAADVLAGNAIDNDVIVPMPSLKRARTRQSLSTSMSAEERALRDATEHLRVIAEQSTKRTELLEEANAIALFAMEELRDSSVAREYCHMAAQFHLTRMKCKLEKQGSEEGDR